jgi:hypothetical protein
MVAWVKWLLEERRVKHAAIALASDVWSSFNEKGGERNLSAMCECMCII